MKKTIILLFTILSLSAFSQNTINKVIYKKRSGITTTKSGNKESDTKNKAIFDDMNSILELRKYILVFNKTESIFFENESVELNSHNPAAKILSQFSGGTKGKFYVDVSKDTILHQKSFRTDLLLIKAKVSDLKWQFDFKTAKKIGEYTCYKATTTKKVLMSSGNIVSQPITAWFCPELPYPFGPTEFAGLPGLILELEYYDKTVIYADKISLNKPIDKKTKPIKPLKKGIKVTNQEYIDFQKRGGRRYKR